MCHVQVGDGNKVQIFDRHCEGLAEGGQGYFECIDNPWRKREVESDGDMIQIEVVDLKLGGLVNWVSDEEGGERVVVTGVMPAVSCRPPRCWSSCMKVVDGSTSNSYLLIMSDRRLLMLGHPMLQRVYVLYVTAQAAANACVRARLCSEQKESRAAESIFAVRVWGIFDVL